MRPIFPTGVGASTATAALRDTVARLCRGFPARYWRDRDAAEEYPSEFVAAAARAGLTSMLVPAEHGGGGATVGEACVALEEMHARGANAGAVHAQMYMSRALARHGSESQRRDVVPKLASGELRLQAFGVTEAESGSDTLALRTRATRVTDGDRSSSWRITGRKIFTSRAEHTDLMLVLARTGGEDRRKGLSTLLVDLRPGLADGTVAVSRIPTLMNHSTCEVRFESFVVPHDALLGPEGHGFDVALSMMNVERLLIAAECLGRGPRRFTCEILCSHT